jgi:ribose transport system substrate-binding protein
MHFYKRARKVVGVVAALAAVSLAAACGSSDADTPGGGGGEVDSSGLQEAKDLVQEYSQRPTEIPNKTPIDVDIPTGKTLTFISCGTASCTLESDIIKSATDKLGWNLVTINTDGTPEKVKAAWQQILREKPDGVLYSATDRAVFEPELQEASAAGIEVAACCSTDKTDDALDYIIGSPAQSADVGKLIAAWVIADSEGSASSVYIDLSVFKILGSVRDTYEQTMDDLCGDCSYDTLDIPITALGKDVPDRIVSYLRSHPDVKYVALSTDSIGTGVPAALRAAGLNEVTVIGEGPDETTLQYIANGERAASIAFPYYEEMYSLVDAMVRMFSGVPLEDSADISIPNWILTADNLPSDSEIFPLVEDVQQQYFDLWGVS